jgi:hypothetical protein
VLRKGRVPPIKSWPSTISIPTPKKSTAYTPIVFANSANPREVFFLNVDKRIASMAVGHAVLSKPALRLQHHTKGFDVNEKDWGAGVETIGTRGDYRAELPIQIEHANSKWKRDEQIFSGKKRTVFFLSPQLFEEIQRHTNAEKAIYQFENALLLLAGKITQKAFDHRFHGRYERGETIYDYVRLAEEKAPYLKRLMSAATTEQTAHVLQKRFSISARLAAQLAQRIMRAKSETPLKGAWQQLLNIVRK